MAVASERKWTEAMKLRSLAVLAVVGTLALVLGGCTGGDDDKAEAEKPTDSAPATAPADCVVQATPSADDAVEGPGVVPTTSIVQSCLDDAFVAAVEDQGSKALRKLPAEQVLGFGHGLCAYATALSADPANAPTYDELVKSTSASWKVETTVFTEVLGLAATLCPGQLQPVLDLRSQAGAGTVEVELGATGSAPMDVRYTGPDGNEMTSSAQTPWTQLIRLDTAADFTFTVTATDGEVSCTLTVKGEEVTSDAGDKNAPADCSASAAELRAAN